MNKKRIVALATTVIMAASIFAGCGTTSNKSSSTAGKTKTSVKIGLSTDKGGRGDKGFNDSAIAGLTKLQNEYTVTPDILESKTETDYEPFLTQLAGKDDLVFGVGFAMNKAITDVANANPDKKFCLIDDTSTAKNVVSVAFKTEQGAFLMGVIAGKTTKTGHVGFIGGIDIPLIEGFEAGYIAGVKSVNPSAAQELISKKNSIYVGAFDKSDLGKEAAKKLFASGCDVVFHAAGASGLGLLDEAHAERAQGKQVWAIGVDMDQAVTVPNDADAILSSEVKRVDVATYSVCKSVIDGTFKGGITVTYGLKEDGVGMAGTTNKHTAKDVVELANKYKEAIISGKIVVPSTLADAKNFQPVQP